MKNIVNNLSPGVKRTLYVAFIVFIVGFVLYAVVPDGNSKNRRDRNIVDHLLTDEDTEQMTVQMLAAKIDALKSDNTKLQRQLDKVVSEQKEITRSKSPSRMLSKQINTMKQSQAQQERQITVLLTRLNQIEENGLELDTELLEQTISERVGEIVRDETGSLIAAPVITGMGEVETKTDNSQNIYKPQPTQNKVKQEDEQYSKNILLQKNAESYFRTAQQPESQSQPQTGNNRSSSGGTQNKEQSEAQIRTIYSDPDQPNSLAAQERKVVSQRKEEERERSESDASVYIPSGSIISGVLMSGMDAPTKVNANKNPYPVMLRVKQDAILPNKYSADIKECFILASGYGDLSSERALIRSEMLSCVLGDGRVIEERLDGYAIGKDSSVGVRGKLVSKQGQLIGNAILVGLADSLGRAFSYSARNSLRNQSYSGSSNKDVTVIDQSAMAGGVAGGMAGGLNQVAQFYIDLAENIMPVIEINAGEEVSFILTKGVKLEAN